MTFQEAVRMGFSRATDFRGRSGKPEFWYFFAFQIVVTAVAWIVGGIIDAGMILGGLVSLALLVPGVAVATRRLHDQGKTGWMLLMGIIPLLGLYLLILFAQPGHRGANKYGPPPPSSGTMMPAT